jgi:hypothetical protein
MSRDSKVEVNDPSTSLRINLTMLIKNAGNKKLITGLPIDHKNSER